MTRDKSPSSTSLRTVVISLALIGSSSAAAWWGRPLYDRWHESMETRPVSHGERGSAPSEHDHVDEHDHGHDHDHEHAHGTAEESPYVGWRERRAAAAAGHVEGEVEAEHAHGGASHHESLELTPQARQNIGLETMRVALSDFDRTVSVPSIVVERPGRSQQEVTAPVGGRIVRVFAIEGQAAVPGDSLFELQLSHEELVTAQADFLRAAEELAVVDREIERLQNVVEGAIPGKTIREREYERQKLRAVLNAQRQSLILHGLSVEQVDRILQDRQLLQRIVVATPDFPPNGHDHDPDHPFHVQALRVKSGQFVNPGDTLCVLADHHELFLEGHAFEQDIDKLTQAIETGVSVTAEPATGGPELIHDLKLFYLSDTVEAETRVFPFYVRLPNRLIRDVTDDTKRRFVTWQFKPGQRMQTRVPVDRWASRIVLPIDAVVQDGVEQYVFRDEGSRVERVPVHVEYRDDRFAVIASDSALVGSQVVIRGSQQLQLAIKNMAGGPIDPHAGHNH